MNVRTFTLKEANRLIPRIKCLFDDTRVMKKKIIMLKNEADWLLQFWGKDLHDADNPDSEKYVRIVEEIENLYTEIRREIGKIQGLGCIVKDADEGLVDFYSTVNGELAFLCWKYGENEIKFWHSIEGGFRGRQPIRRIGMEAGGL